MKKRLLATLWGALSLGLVSGCVAETAPDESTTDIASAEQELTLPTRDPKPFKTLHLPNLFGIPGYENLPFPVYRSVGTKGPGILLIHGNSSSSRAYVNQIFSVLGATQRLYLIDLPGYGAAGHVAANRAFPVDANGIPQGFSEYQVGLVEAIATTAADPEIDPAVFVGWSLGGDVLLLAQGLGLLPHARGLMVLGTAPAGAAAPTTEAPFLPPNVPGLAGLGILPSFGFAFQADSTSPIGFNLSGQLTDPVPAYAPAPIRDAPTTGEAYVRAFFKNSTRLSGNVPASFREDAFDREDPRARGSIGAVALGLLPPSGLPDELDVLRGLEGNPADPSDDVPILIAHGAQDAFVNPAYLAALENAGGIPTLWHDRIVTIPGAGHAAQYEQPVLFNALLATFVHSLGH